MATVAYDNERCMFFVGGNNAAGKSGNAAAGETGGNAGGCTKDWWDTELGGLVVGDAGYEAAAQAAMTKLMATDGSPIQSGGYRVDEWNEDDQWIDLDGSTTGVEVGMIAYGVNTDDVLQDDENYFKVIAVGGSIIRIAANPDAAIEEEGDVTLYIGGAHAKVRTIAELISSDMFTQEIFCNKDFTQSGDWDWSDWGYGDSEKNTWLRVRGFNKAPHDITDRNGNYYASTKEMEDNGADPATGTLVNINLNNLAADFILPELSENIQITGFRFFGQNSGFKILEIAGAGAWSNIEISHNAFKISAHGLHTNDGDRLFFYDNYFYPDGAIDSKFVIEFTADTNAFVAFNRFNFPDLKVVCLQAASDSVFALGNFGVSNWVNSNTGSASFVANAFNTWLNAGDGLGAMRVNNDGTMISLANIIMPALAGEAAIQIAAGGGSVISKNDCGWSEADTILDDFMENLFSDGEAESTEFLIEVDPDLVDDVPTDADVIVGGPLDIATRATTIGAVQAQTEAPVVVTATDDGDGAGFTAAVTGAGTIQLYYKLKTASSWTVGESRSGDGDIAQAVAATGWYECYATATDGGFESGASNIKTVHVASTSAETIETAIVTILAGDTDVTDQVDDRIFPLTVPQCEKMPAITYQQIDDRKIPTHSGPNTLLNTRMQIDCWAKTYAEASALKKAVRLALDGFVGTVNGRKIGNIIMDDSRDLERSVPGADELKRYGKSLDFMIVFNEAAS